jgi:lipid-A-disaccharide synthase
MKKILIIAGEASGDLHGSNLVREVRKLDPSVRFYGVGSRRMREAGVEILADASQISVVGLTEVLLHLRTILNVMKRLKRFVREERPDLLILIDFPDFNIMLGRFARKRGVPVLYYISPQVWAWRKGRIKQIAALVNTMIVVFPFEVELYRKAGVDVRYAGHPLTDVVHSGYSQSEARRELGLDVHARTVALLPGSRTREITSLLPEMLTAGRVLKEQFPDLQFVLPLAPTLDQALINSLVDRAGLPVRIVDGRVYDVLRAADSAVVASGTATLETGLMAVPMVIVYRVSRLSYLIGRMIIDAENVGLVNIIAGRRIVPEFIQNEANAHNIAAAVSRMLSDTAYSDGIRGELASLRNRLGEAGASARAAAVVIETLQATA